jgi:hypothetical protein
MSERKTGMKSASPASTEGRRPGPVNREFEKIHQVFRGFGTYLPIVVE